MNVTELARRLKLNSQELLEILPEFGFDIGMKAIKVDDKIAQKILIIGPRIRDKIKTKEAEKLAKLKSLQVESAEDKPKEIIKIPPVLTVRDFAYTINHPVNQVIKELMKNGVMASLNERIDFDTASIIADEFAVKLEMIAGQEIEAESVQTIKNILAKEKKSELQSRAPIVVIMGHVDHGKTKLLDTIRTTNVVEGEAGGITQHIGAYQVEKKDQKITFIDTPGHEAFTAMRSRGAKVADIAILVVAANDSIKPQTVEAIKIIQQSKVPMIVAINKIDLPEANIEKVKQDLSGMNLIPEDWGGKTIIVPISAKENIGVDDLLDTILLVYEMEKEKIMANPQAEAVGTIIESHIDKGEGPVATVLVQNGTLQKGDNLCVNNVFFGKARALKDYTNKDIESAGPSVPVKIIGLKFAPKVGDIVEVKCTVGREHKKAKAHDINKNDSSLGHVVLREETAEDAKQVKFNVIVKADVLGSLEVILESLEKIESDEIKLKVIDKGLGNITDTDIDRAASAPAIIIGFNVKAIPLAQELAREKEVEILYYDVIYKLIDEVKGKMSLLLSPEMIKKELGKLQVLAIFKTEPKSMVIGCKVLSGKVMKDVKVDVRHNEAFITTGQITELQVGKEPVNEVAEGQDCGLTFVGEPQIEQGDLLDVYQEEKIIKKI